MTPAHTDSPLRRSDAANLFRGSNIGAIAPANITINDDDAERLENRRRTMLSNANNSITDSSGGSLEDNETLKKCLEMYNGNKLSKENAWSMSLIDTLSTLLDRHHKSLNNFKVAGSSLEASSKVYGLRVDSIHNDVLRMSAGLNAQKFAGRNLDADDDDEDNSPVDADNSTAAGNDAANTNNGGVENGAAATAANKVKPKRQRKPKSTITKNKDTINGKLDTVPLQDPIFGKLNTIVGSINSSNRLMNNILPTANSELRLCTNFAFWDKRELPLSIDSNAPQAEQPINYFASVDSNCDPAFSAIFPCDRLFRMEHFDDLQLRYLHPGYVISDTPEAITDDKENNRRFSMDSNDAGNDFDAGGPGDVFRNGQELAMAFDLNAECEQMPELDMQAPVLDVDFNDYDEITTGWSCTIFRYIIYISFVNTCVTPRNIGLRPYTFDQRVILRHFSCVCLSVRLSALLW